MKKYFYHIAFHLMWMSLLFNGNAFAQQPQSMQPGWTAPVNTVFDVIIKKNGDLVYGLVKEVNEVEIRYQRTDIPDGPIYTILRKEVYAISYRNQVKDILSPTIKFPLTGTDSLTVVIPAKAIPKNSFFNHSNVLAGVGFIRGFTKVANSNNYSSRSVFPLISLAYEVQKSEQLRLGLLVSTISNKFSREEYSAYDSAFNSIELKENIFSLYAYGKYMLSGSGNTLQPYVQGGLGVYSSYIRSENTLSFLSNSSHTILVKSGARSTGVTVLLRGGAEYRLNDQFQFFADAGIGPSVIHLGIVYQMSNK